MKQDAFSHGEGTEAHDDQRAIDDTDSLRRSLQGLRFSREGLDIVNDLGRRNLAKGSLAANSQGGDDRLEEGKAHLYG